MRLVSDAASNAKTAQALDGLRAVILHLAPAGTAGVGNVCAWADKCMDPCLNTSGRGQIVGEVIRETLARYSIHRARAAKTVRFMRDRTAFLRDLHADLASLARCAKRDGLRPVARLNGTSDVAWEAFGIPAAHPSVTFYDYTKSAARALAFAEGKLPANYHLTWSFDGFGPCHPGNASVAKRLGIPATNEALARAMLSRGVNVAVVFETLPATFFGTPTALGDAGGYPVIDGTRDDWRFRDPRGVVVGLLPKGRAKRDRSGFVIRNA